jgi:branched-chain amino acid transport system ATP-binding protein
VTILELDGVSVTYGPVVAVRGLSLHVEAGEIVALLGSNGAGKSTTLASIVGLARVAEGRILLEAEDTTGAPTERIVRRGITLVPEGRRVFADLTVADNLRLGAATRSRSEYGETLDEVLELFPVLARRLDVQAGLFSGGEQQMLAIARAMMSRPKVLLLDEPSLGLAPIIVAQVFDLIQQLRDRGVTVLLVEQNVERALEISDRAYVLSSGDLVMSGSPADLPAEEIEKVYLGLTATSAAGGEA